jgi:hypothetical protein
MPIICLLVDLRTVTIHFTARRICCRRISCIISVSTIHRRFPKWTGGFPLRWRSGSHHTALVVLPFPCPRDQFAGPLTTGDLSLHEIDTPSAFHLSLRLGLHAIPKRSVFLELERRKHDWKSHLRTLIYIGVSPPKSIRLRCPTYRVRGRGYGRSLVLFIFMGAPYGLEG